MSRPQGTWFRRREPRKKSPVTPPGIDPGTVRIVAQCVNHYATPGPVMKRSCTNHYKSNPGTSLDRPWRFQEVKVPRFQDNRHMNVVRLSVLRTGNYYKRNTKSWALRRAIRHLRAVSIQCGRSGYRTMSKWEIYWRFGYNIHPTFLKWHTTVDIEQACAVLEC
jgi:hypothetical protein